MTIPIPAKKNKKTLTAISISYKGKKTTVTLPKEMYSGVNDYDMAKKLAKLLVKHP